MSRMTWSVLVASGILLIVSVGCGASRLVIPDPTIPHQLSRDADAYIWVRTSEGKMSENKVKFRTGDWCASQTLIEGNRP